MIVTALLAATLMGLAALGTLKWAHGVGPWRAELERGRVSTSAARFDVREIESLPAPVKRYFCKVLRHGQPVIAGATIRMNGLFNLSSSHQRWRRFASTQRVITRRPGFLWNARISLFPGLAVHVVDSYVLGQGRLRAAIQGLFTVASQAGQGEMARDELMRFLAEAVWYPTALLPSQGVRWLAVDAQSASATLRDGATQVTLLFHFDAAGLIQSFRAESRGRMVDHEVIDTPWEGHFSNYQCRHGMQIPLSGEVAWPEGPQTYFKGEVTQIEFEFALGDNPMG
jgi:hypothetical protein